MNGYLEEGLDRRAAQVHCRILQRRIHLLKLGHHVEDHIGQGEGDVSDQQSAKGEALLHSHHLIANEHEQQAQGNTCHDIRVRHRNVGQAHNSLAQLGLQIVDAHGRYGAEHRSDDGGEGCHQQRVAQKSQQLIVLEQPHILLQCEALKLR